MKSGNISDLPDAEDLFIAVHLSHIEALRKMLMANPELMNEHNRDGDQPIHIAARQNNLEVGRLCIEFDARIGRRNYEALAPIGVARMNGNSEFVQLLNSHYAIDDQLSVGLEEPEKIVFRRTNLSSICSQKVLREEAKQKRLVEQLEYWRYMKKHESATMIQRQVRKLQARRARERLLLKKSCAQRIQSAWRWRHRDEVYRDRQKAARKIQSFERMRVVRTHFINFNYESLSLYRASRVLACVVQRSWRGHRGRSITRRTRELNGLPDPLHVKNFDVWLSFQKAANPPARTWGVYSEYYLSGYPRTWFERNAVKRNGCFRDVRFYAHNITRCGTWDQPKKWHSVDQRAYEQRQSILLIGFTADQDKAARTMQQLWRARVARRHLTLILKAQRLMSTAEEKYEAEPHCLEALCNYTLKTHVGVRDVAKAELLYKDCIDRMLARGGDHSFILYGYAIFLAGNTECEYWCYAERGRNAEERYRKRHNANKASVYLVANEYYRHITISQQQSMQAWHNYALCRWICFDDIRGGSVAFQKALKRAPNDKRILQNLNDMLRRHQKPARADFDVYDLY